MATVYNINEAVTELSRQLKDKSWYLHNYSLLESISDYLDKCEGDLDQNEQIYNHLAYDLKWIDREEDLFPMQL